jgi:transcriptional regulator with XRE-family HTH domain
MIDKKDFVPAKNYAELTTGDVVKILREWQEWSRADLAKHSGININNLSLIEHDRVDIGKKRAEALGKAFGVHPALIMFPNFGAQYLRKAA